VFILQDSDVRVTYEDQQKINLFARTNARLQDMKEELDAKKAWIYCIVSFLLHLKYNLRLDFIFKLNWYIKKSDADSLKFGLNSA